MQPWLSNHVINATNHARWLLCWSNPQPAWIRTQPQSRPGQEREQVLGSWPFVCVSLDQDFVNFGLFCFHSKCLSKKVCKRKKRRTLRKTRRETRWVSEKESTFWGRGVRFGLGEICLPRGTTTFHLDIAKMLFRPSSECALPSFAIGTLICLSPDKMKYF